MSLEISIDKASFDRLNKQLDQFKERTGRSAYDGLVKAAMAIKTEAQLRLKGRGHIVTSRLRNSIYIKAGQKVNIPGNDKSYSDNTGKTYDSELRTVNLSAQEIAIGTNVEYAGAIEYGRKPVAMNKPVYMKGIGWRYIKTFAARSGDSFLYWSFKNVNVEQKLSEKMKEDFNRFTK